MPANLNPAAKVIRYKERAPEIRYLTLAQIDEQLHGLRFNPKLQTMVAVLIYAGLRREELLWLTVDDVDLTRRHGGNGLIRVQAKTIAGERWQPKTKVNRAVPISQALREYLDRYTPPASDDGWYFPSPQGTRWDADNFSSDLRIANANAGLQWGCLDYRHTFGSQLAQSGVSLFKIANAMGNSPQIAHRHYASLATDSLEVDFTFTSSSPDQPDAIRTYRRSQ
jgi:integrase